MNIHPVYAAELLEADPDGIRDTPPHERTLPTALELAAHPERAPDLLAPVTSESRRLAVLLALSVLADAGATNDHCQQLLRLLPKTELTPGERYHLAECYARVAASHRRRQELTAAVTACRAGLEAVEGLPVRATTSALLHNLGVAYEQSGDHHAAAAEFARAGDIETRLGRAEEAQQERDRATRNRQMAKLSPSAQAESMGESGARARQAGDMSKALKDYLLAAQQARRSGDPEAIALAAANLSGVFFYQGEYGKAREVLDEAVLAVVSTAPTRATVRVWATLGTVLSAQGDFDAALCQFQSGLALAKTRKWTAELDSCEYGVAQVALSRHNYLAAYPILQRVLLRRRKAPGRVLRLLSPADARRHAVELGNVLNQLGVASLHLGRREESLRYHREALKTRRGRDVRGSAESAHSLGTLYEHAGDPRMALAYYVRAIRHYETIRKAIHTGAESRARFQERIGGDYVDACRLACALGRGDTAYRVLQRMQNRTLVDGLSSAIVARPTSLPAAPFERERELLGRLAASAENAMTTHDTLRQLASLYARDLRPVAADYVRWRTGEPLAPKELLRDLASFGEGSAYLELLDLTHRSPGEGGQAALLGVCARAGDRAMRSLYSSATVQSSPPVQSDAPALAASAGRVFEQIRAVVGGPGPVFVVAHGPLANAPLQTLLVGERRLLAWQPVRFLPHAGFLAARRWVPPREVSACAVLGDSLDDLPGARAEAEGIGKLLSVEPTIGHDVTVGAICDALVAADLVHVAGHAVFERDDPQGSGLIASDGRVDARQLRHLPMRAGVVVLNACETGVQGQGIGNELDGFVRALLLGGVRHVVCTLCRVDDLVALEFARELYRRLTKPGNDLVESVWRTQLAVAGSAGADAANWSPFILVG